MERVRDCGDYHPFPGWNINHCFCGTDESSVWPCKGDRQREGDVCVWKRTLWKKREIKKMETNKGYRSRPFLKRIKWNGVELYKKNE